MIRRFTGLWLSLAALGTTGVVTAETPFRMQEIETRLNVGYAVVLADVNQDQRPDIVIVDTSRVLWYSNPDWKQHTLIQDQTQKDNVTIAPYDVDGDGAIDFALGAGWRPPNTKMPGTVQWFYRDADLERPWMVTSISEEPSVHRVRWADLNGDGRSELIVVPLMGRETTAPDWNQNPVRIQAFHIPTDPRRDRWIPELLNDDLHVVHNFWPTDFDGDGQLDLIVASFEGVSLLKRQDGKWTRTLIGSGNQQSSPNRGASEIKLGRLSDDSAYIATIEPWHGFQVVVYTPPKAGTQSATGTEGLWQRHVLDESLKWGHAVWCADMDGDADEELIIGVRDNLDPAHPSGVRIYDPAGDSPDGWLQQSLDPAGVAVEDLVVGDLDNDGRAEIVAVGRQTKNARIYWNARP